jgi:membrane AbrB-like protein
LRCSNDVPRAILPDVDVPDQSQPMGVRPSAASRDAAVPILTAVALGTAGGALFQVLQLPLPWMIGSMTAVTLAAMTGLKVHLPAAARMVMVPVIGVMLGAGFTPAAVARMTEWWITMAALAVWTMVGTACAYAYLRRFTDYDQVTAFFSAIPGGLNEMMLFGRYYGADERTISLTHAFRLITVVFTIPFWYRFGGLLAPSSRPPGAALSDLSLGDVGVLSACAVAGALLAQRLRLPAAILIGPMVLSGAAHLAGLTATSPPAILVGAAQVVIGVTVGCRFADVTFRHFGRAIVHAMTVALMMIALTVASSLVMQRLTGLPLPALILGYAPGGLAEMSLIAIALAVDAAFVSCHQIARVVFVIFCAPFLVRLVAPEPARAPADD